MFKWSLLLSIPAFWMADGCQEDHIDVKAAESAPCKSYYNSTLKKQVYTNVEVVPEFPGGAAAYMRYLNKHLKYPQEMIDNEELQSSITMTFIVDENGQIINPRIAKKDVAGYTLFDKEFIRMVKSMPKWEAAICQGKKVTAEITRPMVICIKWETEG